MPPQNSVDSSREEFPEERNSVLDVGTGSGHSIDCAARLGAGEVLGLDIDAEAVRNARENVERNNVSEVVRSEKEGSGRFWKGLSLVVANIDFKNLRRMRWSLTRRLKSKGILILSGILREVEEKFSRYYLDHGLLNSIRTDQEEEWVCLTLKRK